MPGNNLTKGHSMWYIRLALKSCSWNLLCIKKSLFFRWLIGSCASIWVSGLDPHRNSKGKKKTQSVKHLVLADFSLTRECHLLGSHGLLILLPGAQPCGLHRTMLATDCRWPQNWHCSGICSPVACWAQVILYPRSVCSLSLWPSEIFFLKQLV